MTNTYSLGHPSQPRFRVARLAAMRRQRAAELGHGVEIVDRPEFVDMRQQRLDALGLGLEALETQERIEPDQPTAGAVKAVDLEGQAVIGIALEPVRDQQHDRALAEHAARPQLVEG